MRLMIFHLQTDDESCPAEPDSADTLTASLQSDLGGAVASLTWAAEKPAGAQVRPQTRSQVSKRKGKSTDDLKDDKDTVPAQKSAQTVDSGDLKDEKDEVAAQKSAQTVDSRGQVIEDTRDKVVVLERQATQKFVFHIHTKRQMTPKLARDMVFMQRCQKSTVPPCAS